MEPLAGPTFQRGSLTGSTPSVELKPSGDTSFGPVWHGPVPSTLKWPTVDFPVLLIAEEPDRYDLKQWASAASAAVDNHLPTSQGALLFRGLPLDGGPTAVRQFVEELGWQKREYEPFAFKRPKEEGIDLATNISEASMLPCHNEMSYNPRPAARISFFCVQPADDGGESLLARNADLAALLPPDYERRFAERGGIKYVREYGDATAIAQLPKPEPGKMPRWFQSWQERTGTDDRVEAERFWREEMGFEDVRWDEEGTMHLAWHTSAFLRDPATGESLWFNSVDLGDFGGVSYGDGSPIEKDLVQHVQTVRWEAVHALKLQAGDWLVLDNMRVQHGRLPYHGNQRKLMVIMT